MEYDKNELQNYFRDNPNGQKTRIGSIQKKFPSLLKEIDEYNKANELNCDNVIQKIYNYLYEITIIPKCEACQNSTKFRGIFSEGYLKTCSLLCRGKSNVRLERIRSTVIKKYGVDSISKCDKVKKKRKMTYLRKFGNENIFENSEIISKTKKTNLEKYGNEIPFKSDLIKNKTKENNMRKYGVDSPSKLEKNKQHQKNFYLEKLKIKLNEKNYTLIELLDNNLVKVMHSDGHIFEIDRTVLHNRLRYNMDASTLLNPLNGSGSSYERDLNFLLREEFSGLEIMTNRRKILGGTEMDLFFPIHNIGIEINGVYWHSDVFKSDNYHLTKHNVAKSKNIRLIQIFEDEYFHKKEIVLSIIRSKLRGTSIKKYYGRKCEIREVNSIDSKTFLDENHIQGAINSKIRIGLYYDNELLSLMTFGSYRKSMGKTAERNEYELLRLCTKLNCKIIGGATKLYKFFLNNHQPNKVITYCDKRYFDGGVYKNMGFIYDGDTRPNYWYVDKSKILRLHRFGFRKNILVKQGYDTTLTERDIMGRRGFSRIYDCGNMRFEWTPKINEK